MWVHMVSGMGPGIVSSPTISQSGFDTRTGSGGLHGTRKFDFIWNLAVWTDGRVLQYRFT